MAFRRTAPLVSYPDRAGISGKTKTDLAALIFFGGLILKLGDVSALFRKTWREQLCVRKCFHRQTSDRGKQVII